MDKLTKLAHLGRVAKEYEGAVNTPVIRASTILFDDYASYKAALEGRATGLTYGRYGTATCQHLAQTLAQLDGAEQTFLYPSGQSAISMALLSVLSPDDHVLMVDSVYDPVRKFCDHELARMGIETTYYDPLADEAAIEKLIRPNTKAVYVESPGSITFEVQDIPAIARAAHRHGCTVLADNTWATPLAPSLFALGVDVVIHSLTKYACGHADVVMGAVSAGGEAAKRLAMTRKQFGVHVSPDDCYLVLRGLRTLGARLWQQEQTGLALAHWFETRPETLRVLHPALPSCPGHEHWKRDISQSCGLFAVVLKRQPEKALAAMFDGMELFGMGFSWGGFESLMIHLMPKTLRTACAWDDDCTLIRVHAGLEAPQDLIADLEAGFSRLAAAG